MTDLGDNGKHSTDEIRRRLRQIPAERRSTPTTPIIEPTRPQPISEGVAPELSLDEILLKIQRDIAEARPVPVGTRNPKRRQASES